MSSDLGLAPLIGACTLLGLIYVSFRMILRPRRRAGQPPGLGQSRLGLRLSAFLAAAVVLRFFLDAGVQEAAPGVPLLLGGFVVLVALAILPGLEPLIAMAGVGVFLVQTLRTGGPATVGVFLVGLVIYVVVS